MQRSAAVIPVGSFTVNNILAVLLENWLDGPIVFKWEAFEIFQYKLYFIFGRF